MDMRWCWPVLVGCLAGYGHVLVGVGWVLSRAWTCVGVGRCLPVLVGFSRCWLVLAGVGWCWPVLVGDCQCWLVLAGVGWC